MLDKGKNLFYDRKVRVGGGCPSRETAMNREIARMDRLMHLR